VILNQRDSKPLQVQAHSSLYSVWNTHTNISLGMSGPNKSRRGGASELRRVGRCTYISVLDLHSFVLDDSLKMAPRAEICRFDACHKMYFIKYVFWSIY